MGGGPRVLTTRRLIVAAALAAIFAVGGSALLISKDDAGGSGIRGQVVLGCLSAACPPPPWTPTVGLQVVRRWTAGVKPGHEFSLVRKFWSAKDGSFRVSLPPGHYLITQDAKSPVQGGMHPEDVIVRDAEFTDIVIFYDENRG